MMYALNICPFLSSYERFVFAGHKAVTQAEQLSGSTVQGWKCLTLTCALRISFVMSPHRYICRRYLR